MAPKIVVRRATADDYDAIAEVMIDAVRHGRSKYTEGHRRARVPQPRRGSILRTFAHLRRVQAFSGGITNRLRILLNRIKKHVSGYTQV